MATQNLFDLLDDDTEDPSLVIAAAEKKMLEKPKKSPVSAPAQAQPAKPAKLPTKPPPPAQAAREARNEPGRGGGRGGGRGRGLSGRGFNRDSTVSDNSNAFSGGYRPSEEGEERKQTERRGGYGGPRGSFRGGRRGGFNDGEFGEGERPRRVYDRRSGTGHGNEFKRDGAGRGNWGSPTDEVAPEIEENVPEDEKNIGIENQPGEDDAADASKENAAKETEEEPEIKEMTLEEYEKVLEEKRKALLALKTNEERKVDTKEFESMQQLSNKKSNDDIFIKLARYLSFLLLDKRKDADKEEKAKKSVSINEFLKPAEGERYYGPGRGRGRGRGPRGGYGGNATSNVSAPSIEDPGHFPSLGGNVKKDKRASSGGGESSGSVMPAADGNQLVSVHTNDLKFVIEFEEPSDCDLKVVNNTQNHVAFKVKTTSPKKYFVRPNTGIMQPMDSCLIRVTLQAQREYPPDMQCKDKFLLQSTMVPPNTKVDDLPADTFNKDVSKDIRECKLKVHYRSPSAQRNSGDEGFKTFPDQNPDSNSLTRKMQARNPVSFLKCPSCFPESDFAAPERRTRCRSQANTASPTRTGFPEEAKTTEERSWIFDRIRRRCGSGRDNIWVGVESLLV
ncbi:Vesicle-associated protein 2-1 [Hibiscus syriacus]|uniref:Vesicle-associated protein 2-1 n=1 Tax=Hibiscus syriacus TaxID=106335 RepID=A0A6A3CGN4_HIBSY|nr:Vesicle-associated protein 2-1 [Hibiscus syriacus]